MGTGRAGWPRVVSHPRLPQIRTCPTRASGSSDHGIATPKRAPARRRFRRRSANCRTCVETAVGSVSSPSVRPAVHDPIRRFPPPGPRGAGSPTSSVLSADSDFSTPVPPHFVFLRLAVPLGCPVRSRGSGPLPGPGLLFIAAVRAASPVETSRPPRFLGDPCLHAPLSDPGGTACARPSRRRDGAFRSCHSVGFRDVYGFRGSITQPARLPVYASQPGSPPVHATLGSGWSVNLGRSGLSPAGSHRRFLSCHNMPSPFTKLRLAQDKPVPYGLVFPARQRAGCRGENFWHVDNGGGPRARAKLRRPAVYSAGFTPFRSPNVHYRHIAVEPLTPTIGAVVSGVDLARPLPDDTFQEIHDAWMQHCVLLFRNQVMTPEQHLAFGRRFGPLHVHPAAPYAHGTPELMVIETNRGSKRNNGSGWHSDVSADEEPPLGTILHLHEVPSQGGDTLWASMYAAFEALSPSMQALLERSVRPARCGLHRRIRRSSPTAGVPAASVHPVVRTHPVTKRKVLFVNSSFTRRIEGLTVEREPRAPRFPVRARQAPRLPVPLPLGSRLRRHVGQPLHPASRRMGLLPGDAPRVARDGAGRPTVFPVQRATRQPASDHARTVRRRRVTHRR